MLGLKFHNSTNFQSLEVVDRGSETQVAENLIFLPQCSKGYLIYLKTQITDWKIVKKFKMGASQQNKTT